MAGGISTVTPFVTTPLEFQEKGGFQKGGLAEFPGHKTRDEDTKKGTTVQKKARNEGTKMDRGYKNWNEGTFAKTALPQDRPFVSSRLSHLRPHYAT